jgi:hypothetical protein
MQNLLKYINFATLSSLFRGPLIDSAPGLGQAAPKEVPPLLVVRHLLHDTAYSEVHL